MSNKLESNQNKNYVTVIGGVNIDIIGFPYSKLIPMDSNIGKIELALGGVGRNIGENLVRMGIETKLISIVGDDIYGKKIIKESEEIGLDMTFSKIIKGINTSTYLAILDYKKDMSVAISSMDIYEEMTVDDMEENSQVIKNSKLCILDTNIPEKLINHLLLEYKDIDFFVDTVSTGKAVKIKKLIRHIHTLKTNKLEVEAITGIKINDKKDLIKSWLYLKDKGLERLFITLGKEGVYFSDINEEGFLRVKNIKPKNTTGAGDAFTAGLAYCYMKKTPIRESAKVATAASLIALSHENTINPEMTEENLKIKIMEMEIC